MLLRGDDGAAAAAVAPAPAGEENPNQNQALATLADGAGLCRLVQRLSRRPLTFRDAPASALTLHVYPLSLSPLRSSLSMQRWLIRMI